MKAIDIIPEWEPMHAECVTVNPDGVQVESYGIHCGCGARLGWPPAGYELETERPPFDPDYRADPANPDSVVPIEATEVELFDGAPAVPTHRPGMVEPTSAVVPVDPIESALLAMDPTRPYTPVDIERQLVSIVARLEQGQHFQREWEIRANASGVAYELAHARAIVESDGKSKEVREAQALLACEDLYLAKMDAEATVKAVRETMHNLRSMLSGFQSIGRSVGASFNAPNFSH